MRQSCIMQIPLGENDLDLEEEHARGRSHLENMSIFFFFMHIYFPASGQAVVTDVVPSPPGFLPSIFIAHRVHTTAWVLILYMNRSNRTKKKKNSVAYPVYL